jgi:hypothetical protein
MTVVNKIDSNFTGLRFAVESNQVGVLPANPVWYPVEPNSYTKFGGTLKTKARNPINDGRQRKKGVIVDFDALAEYEMDLTEDNTQIMMSSFLFANPRTKVELPVGAVSAAGYAPVAGGAAYFAGNLLYAKGFSLGANNGLSKVTGTPTGVQVPTTAALVTENSVGGVISRVGHEFAASVATIDVSGLLPKLVISGVAAASQALTTTGVFTNGETITVGGKTYTLQTVLTNVDGNVKIAGSTALTLTNIANAITLNGLGVPGTDFALAMTDNPLVSATATSTVLTATADVAGTPGNTIGSTTTTANATWGAATLVGGTGRSFLDFGIIPGEYVCIGDDGVGQSFANQSNNGLKRVRALTDNSLTFDKSTLLMVTDAGTGKTIRVIMGRVIKNEVGANIHRQTLQFERTLGAPDDSSSAVQAEYITGCVANTFDLSIKTADKLNLKLGFMARDQETVTAVQGLKVGTRPVLQESDAYNSSSHVARLSLAAIDPTTATPTDLFAFLLDLDLSIKNNVKANKAVKFLGSFDNSAGIFEVDAKMTAYFATVDAIREVRQNGDVTLDITFAQANKGLTFDLPLVTLASDGANVKQDTAIEIPVTSTAATGSKLDINLNHTLLVQYWDYIPTLAA